MKKACLLEKKLFTVATLTPHAAYNSELYRRLSENAFVNSHNVVSDFRRNLDPTEQQVFAQCCSGNSRETRVLKFKGKTAV